MTGNRAALRARKTKKKSKGPRFGYRIGTWSELTNTSRVTTWRAIRNGALKVVYYNGIPLIPHSEAVRLELADA
jgi:hypothetical protein